MFDFEKLLVYQRAKVFHKNLQFNIVSEVEIDRVIANQLKRAALSIPLNIAEGTSRFSHADKRNFYVIARGSLFECIAILDILKDNFLLNKEEYEELYREGEELSKILFTLIRGLESKVAKL